MHRARAGGRPALSRRRLALLLYGAAAGAYAIDRISKWLVEEHLQGRPPIELIPNVLQLRFTTNPGGAFGLFGSLGWLFLVIGVLVTLVVVVASRDLPDRRTAVALGLVLAGAVGNITDRFVRGEGFSGEVVDFIDFHVWPVFNVADMALVFGAAILVLAGFRERRPTDPGGPETGIADPGGPKTGAADSGAG